MAKTAAHETVAVAIYCCVKRHVVVTDTQLGVAVRAGSLSGSTSLWLPRCHRKGRSPQPQACRRCFLIWYGWRAAACTKASPLSHGHGEKPPGTAGRARYRCDHCKLPMSDNCAADVVDVSKRGVSKSRKPYNVLVVGSLRLPGIQFARDMQRGPIQNPSSPSPHPPR